MVDNTTPTTVSDQLKDIIPDGKDPIVLTFIEVIDKSEYISFKDGFTQEEKYIIMKDIMDQSKNIVNEKLKNVGNYAWQELQITG